MCITRTARTFKPFYIHANALPFEMATAATCESSCSLTMSFITHSECRHTVSEWPFLGKKENQNPECRRRPLQGMECSKCGVAFVATCEIWFGEGCHLKGPGSAVMTAPEHSLTQSHCLSPPPLYRCISPLSYLSFTHSLTPLSLSLTPRLPVALFIGLL